MSTRINVMNLKLIKVNKKYHLVKVEFDQAQQPKFEEKKGKNYVEFGAKNNCFFWGERRRPSIIIPII